MSRTEGMCLNSFRRGLHLTEEDWGIGLHFTGERKSDDLQGARGAVSQKAGRW